MTILKPLATDEEQEMYLRTRLYPDAGVNAIVDLYNEDLQTTEQISSLHIRPDNGFTKLTMTRATLVEDTTYSFTLRQQDRLLYRGKIYVTSSESTEVYHNISNETYVAPQVDEDNDYAIL